MGMIEPKTARQKANEKLASYIFSGEILSCQPREDNTTKPDDRFEKLLGHANWAKLPMAVRKRFGKKFKPGQSVAYQGVVTDMKMSGFGWLFAQALRIIGAPLPYERNSLQQPAVVIVTEPL